MDPALQESSSEYESADEEDILAAAQSEDAAGPSEPAATTSGAVGTSKGAGKYGCNRKCFAKCKLQVARHHFTRTSSLLTSLGLYNIQRMPMRTFHLLKRLGSCADYRRRCMLIAPCCGEAFWCRHCHNAVKSDNEQVRLLRMLW